MNMAHFHLAVNHLPVVGILFGLFVNFIGLIKKDTAITKISFYIYLTVALTAFAAYFSGDGAEEVIENLPGVFKNQIEKHEENALISMIAIQLVGLFSIANLIFMHLKKEIPNSMKTAFLFFVFCTWSLMLWTANSGGQIRHSEILPENQLLLNQKIAPDDD